MASDWKLFTIAAAVVFAIVLGLIVFAIVRWRRRSGDGEPNQFKNNVALEIGWTAAPLALVAVLFYYTFVAEARVDAVATHPDVVVAVTAYRWGWTFAYRGGRTVGGSASAPATFGAAVEPPQLVLPVGETTRIELSARDVSHGFWVPDFLFKRDAIPGQLTAFDLRPERLGTYVGHCSQFCGLDHARMLFTVKVVDKNAYARFQRAT